MVNKCCVPGCDSNYKRKTGAYKKYIKTFLFPKDHELSEKWKKKIPRGDLILTKCTVVCEKHFECSDVIRYDVIPGLNGKPDKRTKRKKLKLKDGAIPTIFPNLPSYLSSTTPHRESPDAKRRKYEEREYKRLQQFLEKDQLVSFSSLKEEVCGFISSLKHTFRIHIHTDNDFICLYKLDFDDDKGKDQGLKVTFSLKICSDFSIRVWKDNIALGAKHLQWITSKDGKLSRWSQIKNLLSHYCVCDNDNADSVSKDILFDHGVSCLERASGDTINDDSDSSLDIIIEQLKLSKVAPSRRRYSTESVIFAFCLYFTSPSAYRKIRNSFLILPSIRYLQHLCQNVSCEKGLLDISFLEKEVANLNVKDLVVNLLIDEIHVKQKLGYRGERLIGQASNDVDSLANSIQCFMLSSVMSKSRIVVGMLPVKNMNSEFLLNSTKSVVENCSKAGFDIVSIISDNNRINRKMFSLLTVGSESRFYFYNPIDDEKKIFLLFDTVHLMKTIRNNWLNVKNQTQTLSFPDFHDDVDNVTCTVNRASFMDLKTLYKSEENEILKGAHTLTWKALYPHSLERQKVSLALKIFHESNIATLKTVGPQRDDFVSWEGTVTFLELICHWWEIVNVQHRFYGRNKLKPHATPFYDVNDPRLSWLMNMASWLDRWNAICKKSNEGFLSNDTYQALKHSLHSIVALIKYLITSGKMEFVLTGKFQTDNLEGRFGQYRQMSGGCTLISVEEALQSERKLRVSSLLNIHSMSAGTIPIREFLNEFAPATSQGFDVAFVSSFPYDDISSCSNDSDDTMNVIVYVAGYVAKKLLSKLDCSACCQIIGDKGKTLEVNVDTDLLNYYDNLNRGGLVYPSTILVNVLQLALKIMNVIVSSMENEFLSLKNQKQTLIQINKASWPDSDFASELYAQCDTCGKDFENIFLMGLKTFVNILLNNYSKRLTDTCKGKGSAVKKKAQKFHE